MSDPNDLAAGFKPLVGVQDVTPSRQQPTNNALFNNLANLGIASAIQAFGGNDPQIEKVGYQGGIPEYTSLRERVPYTNDPTRRPGSGGQRYFTDVGFSRAPEDPSVLAAQNLYNIAREDTRAVPPVQSGIGSAISFVDLDKLTSSELQEEKSGIANELLRLRGSTAPARIAPARTAPAPARTVPAPPARTVPAPPVRTAPAPAPIAPEIDYDNIGHYISIPTAPTPIAPEIDYDQLSPRIIDALKDNPRDVTYFEHTNIFGEVERAPTSTLYGMNPYTLPEGSSRRSLFEETGWVPPQVGTVLNPSEQLWRNEKTGETFEGRTGWTPPSKDWVATRQFLAAGGMAQADPRYFAGSSDGMADLLPANIDGQQEARLSDGEFVMPADVVSHLGNGNSNAGADVLYNMMDRVRQARTGTEQQGRQINPNKMLPV